MQLSHWHREKESHKGCVHNVHACICILPLVIDVELSNWNCLNELSWVILTSRIPYAASAVCLFFFFPLRVTGKLEVDLSEWLQSSRGSQAIVFPQVLCRLYAKFAQATRWVCSAIWNCRHNFEVKNKTRLADCFKRLSFSSMPNVVKEKDCSLQMNVEYHPDSTELHRQTHLYPCATVWVSAVAQQFHTSAFLVWFKHSSRCIL